MKFIFLIATTLLFLNCNTIRIKDKLIGDTSIEKKYDESGALVYYKKTNTKGSRFISHPHNTAIIHTKTKVFEDHKPFVFVYQKTKRSITDWDGTILKSRKIVWDENGKKTVTRTSKK